MPTRWTLLFSEIIGGTYEEGTKEQKIADFYKNVADMDSRNEIGVAPAHTLSGAD